MEPPLSPLPGMELPSPSQEQADVLVSMRLARLDRDYRACLAAENLLAENAGIAAESKHLDFERQHRRLESASPRQGFAGSYAPLQQSSQEPASPHIDESGAQSSEPEKPLPTEITEEPGKLCDNTMDLPTSESVEQN